MEYFITFIALGSIIFLVESIYSSYDKNKIKENQKRKDIYDKYGNPTLIIEGGVSGICLYVYEQAEFIIINNIQVLFKEILDFRINNEKSYKTSTMRMIGRGVIGASLFGGIGAIVGGNTAARESSTSKYVIYITLNNMSNPVIEFSTTSPQCAEQIISILKIIIDRQQSIS